MALTGASIASYMTVADGNVSNGSNWALIDSISNVFLAPTSGTGNFFAAGSAGSGAGTVSATTAYQKSLTWTYASSPPTIDGFAVQIYSANGTGTITLGLDLANADVTGTIVTVNISDLPPNGWVFFKLPAPVTLTVATYSIKFKTSIGNSCVLIAGTTMCHFLRTTTTGTAPQAASGQKDNMFILGEVTGVGTHNSRAMIWDITSNAFAYNWVNVCQYGTLTLENNAATNYYMPMQNDMLISYGATVNIGSAITPVQGTFTLTFTYGTQMQVILVLNGATLNVYGATKTTTKTLLASNAAAAATSISVVAATGWNVGDNLGIATTTVTANQCEYATISSVSGTTIGIGALTNAHSGTSPKQAEVINLSRNTVFRMNTNGQNGGIVLIVLTGANVVMHYVECRDMYGGYTNCGGMYLNSGTGNVVDIQYCSIYNSGSATGGQEINVIIGGVSGTTIFSNNVIYKSNYAAFNTIYSSTFTGTATIDNNVFMLTNSGNSSTYGALFQLAGTLATFTNNTIVGCCSGVSTSFGSLFINGPGTTGTISGNTIHGSASYGLMIGPPLTAGPSTLWNYTITNTTVWCCSMAIGTQLEYNGNGLYINGLTAFSNTSEHIWIASSLNGAITFNNLQLQAGTSPATPIGIHCTGQLNISVLDILITNSNIGDVTAHSTGDIFFNRGIVGSIRLQNSKLGSTNTVVGTSNFLSGAFVNSDRHQQTNGKYAAWTNTGVLSSDTTIFSTASPSFRLTPNNALSKLAGGAFLVAVTDTSTPTVSIKVRRSATSTGDAATYNGNLPRLLLSACPQGGQNSTLVLATASAASAGAWETLTATLPAPTGDTIYRMYIDCDGTTGWINVDDFSTSQVSSNQGGMSFSSGGVPSATLGNGTNATITINNVIPILRKKVM